MGGAFWNLGNLWWLGYLLAKNFDATFAKKCAKFRHGSIAAPFVGLPWAVGVSIIGCQLPATSYE